MICPKCQFENPNDAQYCIECGKSIEFHCPHCEVVTPAIGKFCKACGHHLEAHPKDPPNKTSFDEKLEKIQKYLPKGLTEKILSQRDRIEGERKQVSVMFCDLTGFTPMSEKIGSESAYNIMDQVYEILIHKVRDYDGTVNEMTGDGIMALFGAPIALEDASQRAIRSSLAIHREIGKLSDKLKKEKKDMPPLIMRAGIHTGPVVVGTLGNDLRVEFKAVGDTVNIASRLESMAEPGSTYVTEEIFKLTEGLFRFEALGQKQVKGKEKPIGVYRVIAPSTRRSRFDVSAERGLTPFAGRERELSLLLEGFERSKGGRGQAFSIVSEAGAGKSRLLYEFRKAVTISDVMFLEGRCLSYSSGIAYHPIIDILKANFDIRETDLDSVIRHKVKTGLRILELDESAALPYILELFSVKNSGMERIPISPEARKDRTIEAIINIALKGSEIRPLIMAFEDLHWSDKSSQEAFKYLLDCITGSRIFLMFTYRPEYVHTWGGRSYHSQVTLNRLSNHESLAMVTHILNTKEIDKDLEELILEKTEGIPFFIEEFTRSLRDLKVIKRKGHQYIIEESIKNVTIHSTIQDVIMARVDSLPEGAKEILQTGSVIEREFSYELIKRVSRLTEQVLLSHLSVLKDSELLYEAGIYPDSRYIFKHSLTREVVYNSILKKRKKDTHMEIANAIEEFYKDNLSDHWTVLTEHFFQSEEYAKAAEYSKLAGKKAQKAGSFKEAIECAKKRVFCLEKLTKTDAIQKKIIDSRTILSAYFTSISHVVEAKESVAPIAELAIKLNYKKRLPVIYATIGAYSLWVEEDYSEGYKYLNKAIKIADQIGDNVSLWFSSYYLGGMEAWNCRFERAFNYLKKCHELSGLTNNLSGISLAKSAMVTLYAYQGRINLACQTSQEAFQIAEESGDIFAKGPAYISYGSSFYYKGLFDEAEEKLPNGLVFCEKTSLVFYWTFGYFILGEICFSLEQFGRSMRYYEKASYLFETNRLSPSWNNLLKLCVTRTKVLKGDQDVKLSELFKCHRRIKLNVIKGFSARYIAEILLIVGDQSLSDAEKWIAKAIEVNEKNGTIWFLAGDYTIFAEILKQKGDQSKAKECLEKAIQIYKKCGADGWVEKTEKNLSLI
jgi:class 3 adenylate cyclase/tetratricopeptide (TPR) repeat protein